MADWKPIEEIDFDSELWVIKYDIFFDKAGQFCKADTPGATKFTDVHGYYEEQEDALEVLHHFPKPNTYSLEKIRRRVLLRKKPAKLDPYSCAVCNSAPHGTPGYAPCPQTACPYKKG